MKTWDEKRFYSIDSYLKANYGEKVYRLSLNGGLSCPNRDGSLGTGGCIFCSEGGSGDFAGTGSFLNAAANHTDISSNIAQQLAAQKQLVRKKCICNKFIAYFQAFSNTYGPVDYLSRLFYAAICDPEVVILSIATRPDCFSEEIYALLEELNQIKPVWVELGLQSIHEQTADFIHRGFSLSCYETCVQRLKSLHIPVITHVILGLPGETKEQMLATVDYLAKSHIFGIKLQLLHVLKQTKLAELYEADPFPLFTLEGYCDLIADCLERLPESMTVHRITGDGPRSLLLAPSWSTDKKRVLNTINHRLKEKNTWQGRVLNK